MEKLLKCQLYDKVLSFISKNKNITYFKVINSNITKGKNGSSFITALDYLIEEGYINKGGSRYKPDEQYSLSSKGQDKITHTFTQIYKSNLEDRKAHFENMKTNTTFVNKQIRNLKIDMIIKIISIIILIPASIVAIFHVISIFQKYKFDTKNNVDKNNTQNTKDKDNSKDSLNNRMIRVK